MCVKWLIKQFVIYLGVGVILLLNVKDEFIVGGAAFWTSKECACCVSEFWTL